MLDSQILRKDSENVVKSLKTRGFILDIQKFHTLDAERKRIQVSLEAYQAQMNQAATEMSGAKGDVEVFTQKRTALAELSQTIKEQQVVLQNILEELESFLSLIPNIPEASVPVGTTEADNLEIKRHGTPHVFNYPVLDHVAIASRAMSFEQGARISGARFVVLHGALARLHRVLAQWMLDVHCSRGYSEVQVPFLVHNDAMFGTGQLPKFGEDQYNIAEDGMYLIPTAEVPVTNLYRESILSATDLPMKHVAYSACFRREAGSYGKDTRGMIRLHQFDKVELVQWSMAEYAMEAHEHLTLDAEHILQLLELPYRKVVLCTGDMGFSAIKTYDLEVWLPSQNTYREISSCSVFGDFQARRMKTRVRLSDGSMRYPYTLNGSGLAVGRSLVAILENYQQENGDVLIPKILQPYMQGLDRILQKDLI